MIFTRKKNISKMLTISKKWCKRNSTTCNCEQICFPVGINAILNKMLCLIKCVKREFNFLNCESAFIFYLMVAINIFCYTVANKISKTFLHLIICCEYLAVGETAEKKLLFFTSRISLETTSYCARTNDICLNF